MYVLHKFATFNVVLFVLLHLLLGNKCNRVKGHGIIQASNVSKDVIKKLIYNMNYIEK